MLTRFSGFKRLFSTQEATGRFLRYAKRCENGQGSSFKFSMADTCMKEAAGNIDVSYSTFWNDFSHYSFYTEDTTHEKVISPIAYDSQSQEDMLFADKDKFIEAINEDLITFKEDQLGQNKREGFEFNSQCDGQFFAHIPQDFNVDVRTTGHIFGINQGDSKLLSLTAHLESIRGGVTARRLKADKCSLIGGLHVQVTSSLEAGEFFCQAGEGGFSVGRKLGIQQQGLIESQGKVKIGSIFSKMSDLTKATVATKSEDFGQETFMTQMAEQESVKDCLQIKAENDIMIDNLQGMVNLHTSKPVKITLFSVESGRLIVNAPNSEIDIYLRSVDDLSLVNCRKANIFIDEEFEGCQIFDQKANDFQVGRDFTDKAILKILSAEGTQVRAMDGF